jgi:hypothetical protein
MDNKHVEEFHTNGYTVLENFFTNEELSLVATDISRLVDSLVSKLGDKLKDKYENEEMAKRLTLIERDCPGSAVILHTMAARMINSSFFFFFLI